MDDDKIIRALALALAVWSHGPVPGKKSEDCFPERAKRFERYLKKGK